MLYLRMWVIEVRNLGLKIVHEVCDMVWLFCSFFNIVLDDEQQECLADEGSAAKCPPVCSSNINDPPIKRKRKGTDDTPAVEPLRLEAQVSAYALMCLRPSQSWIYMCC